MIQKKTGVLIEFLFLIILFLGFSVAVQNDCEIIDLSVGSCSNNKIVMKLSDTTNAHGETWDGGYNYTICCDWGTSSSHDCSTDDHYLYPNVPENKIIGLSSATNAHAERTEETTYSTDVCFEDISCISTIMDCPPEYLINVFSLSGNSNAHISTTGAYTIDICCKKVEESYCGDGVAEGDEKCDSGPGCNMTEPSECTCEAGYTPYDPVAPGCIELREYCIGDDCAYWTTTEGGNTQITGLVIYVGITPAFMKLEYSGTAAGSYDFEIYEADTGGDEEIRVGEDNITGYVDGEGNVIGNLTLNEEDIEKAKSLLEGEEYEFYFRIDGKKSGELKVKVEEPPFCGTINRCMDYGVEDCEKNSCDVANYSVELNNPDITCGEDGITCECWWNEETGECSSKWVSLDIGFCNYTESVESECSEDNLFLTYSWDATWTWAPGNEVIQDDPEGLEAQCVGGQNVVPCPAQIRLPFFNKYTAVAVIIVIVLIYIVLNLRKKRKKKSRAGSKRKRKKK